MSESSKLSHVRQQMVGGDGTMVAKAWGGMEDQVGANTLTHSTTQLHTYKRMAKILDKLEIYISFSKC